ncbi:hypothetical protein [Pacificispira sp.]|uniref:hypothetical protein n=1 Tax=Pacificispira sp. TaxID=2888761 RepID=UPI003B525046
MKKSEYNDLIEKIFGAISTNPHAGLMCSFMFSKPGEPFGFGGMGTEIYLHPTKLTSAALFARTKGPPYLKYLSIDDMRSLLQDFIIDNYWHLADETMFRQDNRAFSQIISSDTKDPFAGLIEQSNIFTPVNNLTLYPLCTVSVSEDFNSENFFLIKPDSLGQVLLPNDVDPKHLVFNRFPPIVDWKGRTEHVTAWLGVRSPAEQASFKMRAAILGAIALKPMHKHRYMFSGRHMFGGQCTVSAEGASTKFGGEHTPPMMHDILIGKDDHLWLSSLSTKLAENKKAIRREVKALEYFYKAWPLEPSDRFAILCMTLDAVFGDANHATQAVIDGVRNIIGSHVQDARLRLLMYLRAAVIHGGAPDVFDSSKYAKYFTDYDADPVRDMEQVVAACLNMKIFDSKILHGEDPGADLIRIAQQNGEMVRKMFGK